MMLNDLETYPHKSNLAMQVRNILQNTGFNDVWMLQGVGDTTGFLNVFKQRVRDNFMQNWNSSLQISSRASTYIFISDFNFKTYLDNVNIVKYRMYITRLRVSAHNLEIETGRWHKPNKIPRNDRKCKHCNTWEEEFHFIIKRFYWNRPNIPTFIELLTCENVKIIQNLSVYIFKSFKLREEML